MSKLTLRPLRLLRINTGQLETYKHISSMENNNSKVGGKEQTADGLQQPSSGKSVAAASILRETDISLGEAGARELLKRTPNSYLLNQAYGLWFFISIFLLTLVITHEVSTEQYGIYAVVQTAYNTILYVVAFGFEDATYTFVPRVFAEHGPASAASLIRRLLMARLGILAVSVIVILFALPVLATLIEFSHLSIHLKLSFLKGAIDIQAQQVAAGLRNPELQAYIIPISIYVVGSSVGSLLNAVCAALMRMHIVLVIGSLTQLAMLIIGFIVLQLGGGITGMIWLLAIGSVLNMLAFAIWLAPLLLKRGASYKQPLKPLFQLGISAWLTNLATGALLKQISIILLGVFAISLIDVGYFNLSFQLADAANLLLVTGFGGVAGSALAAAFVGNNYERLSLSWQTLIRVETLLAAPGLVFCLFNAPNIAHALYGSTYDPVGPLLAIFIFFNIFVRVLGTTIHQSTLYVVNKSRLVVLGEWIGILALIIMGAILIPSFGPAGALIADGVARVLTGGLLLAFLWRDLPHKYPIKFTLRFLLALILAALPSILWHPADRTLLVISGCLFIVLCLGLLLWIKPLTGEDMEMVKGVNPRIAVYLKWFARG
ncbi:oligosaccharide flippase family protein [Ktedonosporobacter rubrisoli]|nr:oligosaccharide flippase family protein [Ktedonosporobacter rubrisoli]